jgi:hypothetical protein
MENVDTLEYHMKNPDVSVERYIRRKRIELAHEIQSAKKIYLDTKFWIILRDARIGKVVDNNIVQLLHVLEDLVAKNLVVCPISNDTFAEIFKQTDTKTLKASAQIIDDLSKGVAILAMKERIDLEVFHFICEKTKGSDSVYSPDELVWTKIAYVLGFVTPISDSLPPDINCAIQKAFIDQMWVVTLTEILEQMGDYTVSRMPKFPDISQKLNEGKFAHIDDQKSFKQLFIAELAGILELYKPDFQDLMVYIYKSDTGQSLRADEISSNDAGRMFANLIYHAFRLNKIKSELSSFRISAGIHAAVQWDKGRKYKPNDLHDFNHATAAVPYCDYFLTEANLRHLLYDKNLKLDTLFRCKTISDITDAIKELSQIAM